MHNSRFLSINGAIVWMGFNDLYDQNTNESKSRGNPLPAQCWKYAGENL